MHFLSTVLALMGLLTQVSTSKTINVAVGQHGLQYVPSTIVADLGDTVQFNFYNIHSVVQSKPPYPCSPQDGGLYSGIMSSCLGCGPAPQRFVHTVADAEPIWFYCSLKGHCHSGMIGVINPPLNRTLADYITAAKQVDPDAGSNILSPYADPPIGGVFINVTSSSSTSRATATPAYPSLQGGGGGGGGQAPFQGTARTLTAFPTPSAESSSADTSSPLSTTSISTLLAISSTSTPPQTSTTSISTSIPSSGSSRRIGTALSVRVKADQMTWHMAWFLCCVSFVALLMCVFLWP